MERWSVLGKLFDWFGQLDSQSVGPFITLSSLGAALVALNVTTVHFEAEALTKQLFEDRAKYEHRLSEIQDNMEKRIPDTVGSPLPVFPQNNQTLLLGPEGGRTLDLEWADRDGGHGHKYLVQVVCIADVPDGKPTENSETQRDPISRCGPDKLDADTPEGKTFHWTQPGVDTVKVPIKHPGTYAWRVARGESDDKGDTTIFEEWSPYFLFTVFESIQSRVEVMNEVRIGIVKGSLLEKKIEKATEEKDRANEKKEEAKKEKDLASMEKYLVDFIQESYFNKLLKQKEEHNNEQKRYRPYPTYEALIEAVVRGEVDYAIGEITRATVREKDGVFFTQGYNDALPIFVSKPGRTEPPGDGGTIGVLIGSIYEQALTQLKESKQFAIVTELTLEALEDDLRHDSVNFVFTGPERLKHLLDRRDSNGQEEFVSGGTLYSELKDFYDDKLGYSPMYAIATADQLLCKALDKLVERTVSERRSQDGFLNGINKIYREEGKSFLNASLYFRFLDHLNRSVKTPCVKP